MTIHFLCGLYKSNALLRRVFSSQLVSHLFNAPRFGVFWDGDHLEFINANYSIFLSMMPNSTKKELF